MPNLERVCRIEATPDRGWGIGVETGRVFVRQKRPPARKPKGKAKRGKAAKSRGGFRLFEGLEQRHLDFIGLFLVATGIYLLFVMFFGWEGGKVGYGIETGLIYLFGSVGARIFTLLMLVAGGMLLTGTSVSALARGIGNGLRTLFFGGVRGGEATARTVAKGQDQWRQRRDERTAETKAVATDVMSDYPEDDEDFEPTVALADDDDMFAPGVFDADTQTNFTDDGPAEPEPEMTDHDYPDPEPQQHPLPVEEAKESPKPTPMGNLRGVTTSEEIDY